MPNKYYTREERKEMVVLALLVKVQHGEPPEGTAYKIARLVDMSVSPNLYCILSEMVTEGRLTARDERNGRDTKRVVYSLPEGSYRTPVDRREIKIRVGGKVF
jgi:hypothetical protein